MKYLVVVIEYFTKWIETEPVAQITAHKAQHFVWKNIVCRFGVPRRLVSDNGTQFASQQLGKLCSELCVKEYWQQMMLYMIREGINEENHTTISMCLSGLKLEIRNKVELLPYKDLNDLIQLSIKVEK